MAKNKQKQREGRPEKGSLLIYPRKRYDESSGWEDSPELGKWGAEEEPWRLGGGF